MKVNLIIFLCLWCPFNASAQQVLELPLTSGKMTPGVADSIFDPRKALIREKPTQTWQKIIVTEIDLNLPENKMLDSLFNFYGEVSTFRQLMCESVLRRKVRLYTGMTKDKLELTVVEPKEVRHIVDESKLLVLDRIVLLEEWKYYEREHRVEARDLAIAIAYKNKEAEIIPFFWVMYPEMAIVFGRYKFLSDGNKKSLVEFFERRNFEAITPYLEKYQTYFIHRISSSPFR